MITSDDSTNNATLAERHAALEREIERLRAELEAQKRTESLRPSTQIMQTGAKAGQVGGGVIQAAWCDLTARIHADEALRESEDRFRAIVENAPISMAIVSMDGVIEYINRKAIETFGYLPTDIPTMSHWWVLAYPDEKYRTEVIARWTGLVQEAIAESHEITGGEYRVTCKDGTLKTVFIFGVPVANKVFVMFDDITARKRAEEALQYSQQRLLQAEKMDSLGQLAGGMAHDFNNQLAGILSYAEMLSQRATDEQSKLYANTIERIATRSGALTRQLLAFARKGKYQTAPVEVHGLINEVVTLLARTVDKRISMQQLLAAKPLTTMGDPIQLQNALLNLAINARDAMPDGGKLVFATAVVTLDEECCRTALLPVLPGTYVEISVADTGVGMSAETKKRLFEPFFTTKAPGKGTGMGLAAVYGTVANHRGTISVTSELNHGSTFTLHLPLLETARTVETPVTTAVPVRGSAHILLVDDETIVRDAIAASLRQFGYRVTTCADGVEALAFYRNNFKQVDLVLLDMLMPNLNGRDTFLTMRQINPEARVILSSGYSLDDDVQRLLDAGALYFIQKPFRAAELTKKISAVLQK